MSRSVQLAIIGVLSLALLLGRALSGGPEPAGARPLAPCVPGSAAPACAEGQAILNQVPPPDGLDENEFVLAPVGPGGALVFLTLGRLADIYQASPPEARAAILSQLPPPVASRLIVAALFRQARAPQPVVQPILSTFAPLPTNTPLPTATATAIPRGTLTPTPVPGCAISAFVSNATPTPGSTETVFGRLLCNGVPVVGAVMNTTWNFPSGTQTCNGSITDATGTANCTLVVPAEPAGTIVPIAVTIFANNTSYGATTSFIVQ